MPFEIISYFQALYLQYNVVPWKILYLPRLFFVPLPVPDWQKNRHKHNNLNILWFFALIYFVTKYLLTLNTYRINYTMNTAA